MVRVQSDNMLGFLNFRERGGLEGRYPHLETYSFSHQFLPNIIFHIIIFIYSVQIFLFECPGVHLTSSFNFFLNQFFLMSSL